MESIDDNRNLINMSQSFDSSPQAITREENIESLNKIIIEQAELIAQLQQENISLKKTLGERDVSSRDAKEMISFDHLCSEILSEIFKHLSVPDLKNSRLVCTKWNVVAVSQQPAQLILNVDKFMDQNNITKLEKQLTRRIQFDKCINWEGIPGYMARSFEGLAAIIGVNVKEIRFNSEKTVRVPSIFCHLLQNKTFPNLSTISGRFFVSDLQGQIAIGSLDTLKTIDVRTKESFLQALINSAPNLESLTFNGNIIKLPENSKLKSLEYTAKALKPKMNKLLNLIMTCSSTLTSLSLLSQNVQHNRKPDIFVLPRLPNLLKLKLSGQFQHQIGARVYNFVPNNLPKLESLRLLGVYEVPLANFLFTKKFQQDFEMPTLKSLKFDGVKDTKRFFFQVRIYFPNVKELELIVDGQLEDIFECVKDFDLEYLKISIANLFDLSNIVCLLRDNYALLFKGLKTFRFENQIDKTDFQYFQYSGDEYPEMSHVSDYDLKVLKRVFLGVKEFEGLEVIFHNFTFNASIGHELMKYILENKIAIRFTCDTY